MPAPEGPNLARLNDAERRALRLLAEGHTAKSIAAVIGCSPASVNERLREARRKTGTGSSRELARLLRAQENRHDEIGLAPPSPSAAMPVAVAAFADRRKGLLAMTLLMITVVAAGLAITGLPAGPAAVPKVASPDPAPVEDSLLGGPMPSNPGPSRLHAALRTEPRDPAWASESEEALRDRYARIPHLSGPGGALRGTCGSTVCEVAGYIDLPKPGSGDEKALKEFQAVMAALQSGLGQGALHHEVKKLGLELGGTLFTSTRQEPKKPVFFAYWTRGKV